jgi:hypothetical protein
MTAYTATVRWNRDDAVFADGRYSRAHARAFDGGIATSVKTRVWVET